MTSLKEKFDSINKDKCVPDLYDLEDALFVSDSEYISLYSPEEASKEGIKPYSGNYSELSIEAKDWLNEMPVVVIKKGATLVHQTRLTSVLYTTQDDVSLNVANACWWEKFYPGQKEYGGGWFTYGTDYGGPPFGLALKYKVQQDFSILFIPNKYRTLLKESNADISLNRNERSHAGSHLIEGVEGWKEKGYAKITNSYFADDLGKRFSELKLNGYISCDENEVFLSHNLMLSGVISYPFGIYITQKGLQYFNYRKSQIPKVLKFLMDYCTPQRSTMKITERKDRYSNPESIYIDVDLE
jgi:hypothetical protein